MGSSSKKIIAALVVLIVGGGLFFWLHKTPTPTPVPSATPTPGPIHVVIGHSVQGRAIDAYTYGTGTTTLLFVGGMHGGYEWNAVLLAYQAMDYFSANPSAIPQNISLTIIPDLNPDGVFKAIGKEGRFSVDDVPAGPALSLAPGRFNADKVDLNRNFDCNWQPTSTWQNKTESAGTAAFSEPEAAALRDFVLSTKPAAAIFWHSQSGTVYASECNKGILPADLDIMNAYAKAAGYQTNKVFDAYSITGDSEGWLASIGIPALTVELTTHDTIEWTKNLAGIKAAMEYYSNIK